LERTPARSREAYQQRLMRLASRYTEQLTEAFMNDPFLPAEVKYQMYWNINGMRGWLRWLPRWVDNFLPKNAGLRRHASPWATRELLNMAKGHHNETSDIRFDGISKKVIPIHLGEWMPTMDINTRRFHEVRFKADLTLPYEHRALVTMRNFVADSPNLPIIGFSGTIGKVLAGQLTARSGRFSIVGEGSAGFKNVGIEVARGRSGKFDLVAQSVLRTLNNPRNEGLTVVNLSNSHELKLLRRYLVNRGLVSNRQIASVFSDAVQLSQTRPQARVFEQMNLEAMSSGQVKILLLDTRIGGRGLDLNHKGDGKFQGYKDVDILFLDPQGYSAVHELQAGGRQDPDRLPTDARRRFTRVIDIHTLQSDPQFLQMALYHPVFRSLIQNLRTNPPPGLRTRLGGGRGDPTWKDVQSYINSLDRSNPISQGYYRVVEDYIRKSQRTQELDQLRASQFMRGDGAAGGNSVLQWVPSMTPAPARAIDVQSPAQRVQPTPARPVK